MPRCSFEALNIRKRALKNPKNIRGISDHPHCPSK
jgi:hypothetical protein